VMSALVMSTVVEEHTGVDRDVEPGGDDTSLVQSTVELDNNLSSSVVIDDLEFTNVT
jgi:hypothetical protein